MKISVVGQGYVGFPLAMAAAKSGHYVFGIDTNLTLVEKIKNGFSPISDISNQSLVENKENYSISNKFEKIKESEVIVVCVPTPLDIAHKPDISILKSAVYEISKNLPEYALVIIESTVAPGTTKEVIYKILNDSNKKFKLAYSPERIDPANKKWNISNTPKLVAGIDLESSNSAEEFYKSFIDQVIVFPTIEVIETAKLLENSFRLVNISLINEISNFCHKMNIDVLDVVKAASTKPYGFMPFYPSVGVGGHCIPVDPEYLIGKAKEIGAPLKIIELAGEINNSLPNRFVEIAKERIGDLSGKNILIVGIAYKADVSDVRESSAILLIELLRKSGAKVFWFDDLVGNWNGESSTNPTNNYDLIIIANPHSHMDLSALDSNFVLDTRGKY